MTWRWVTTHVRVTNWVKILVKVMLRNPIFVNQQWLFSHLKTSHKFFSKNTISLAIFGGFWKLNYKCSYITFPFQTDNQNWFLFTLKLDFLSMLASMHSDSRVTQLLLLHNNSKCQDVYWNNVYWTKCGLGVNIIVTGLLWMSV